MIQLLPSESVLFALRGLYEKHGYSQYKMNKFEEYDLYAKNKDFLISDSVITFTDGNGKLLALKPDVTLSIVKNTADTKDSLRKLYYNENVYRIAKGSRNVKEIMQVGLECIGNVDRYSILEVLKTAKESLDEIDKTNVLSVSHLGILTDVMDYIGVPATGKREVMRLVGERNLHELANVFSGFGIGEEKTELFKKLVKLGGKTADVVSELKKDFGNIVKKETLDEFCDVMTALSACENVITDFTTVGDINYYNGFVFKGFAEKIPQSVLSGGQYDTLMKKMGRTSGAIGFAVYLDTVEQFNRKPETFDVDCFLLYDRSCSISEIAAETEKLIACGESVLTGTAVPDGLKYKKLVTVRNGRAKNA